MSSPDSSRADTPRPDQIADDATAHHGNLENTRAHASEGIHQEATAEIVPQALLGFYQLLEKLGQGGMGTVYKARHTKLHKVVALKLLPSNLTRDAAALARFEREMKAVGALEHPNIVRAMDAGEVSGTHYLVMEYVDGVDLQKLVKERGPLQVAEACRIVHQAAVGLAHAHEHGLIHRDIKPSNLLLASTGQVKILDLGLARLAHEEVHEELTSTGVSLGTPDYMAPEQWADTHAVDHRADLYALGCTLFYLLAGRPPFADEQHRTVVSKMTGHVTGAVPNLKGLRSEVPEQVATICERLLAKRPDDRIASAGDLAAQLEPLCGGKLPATDAPQPPTLTSSATRAASRRVSAVAWPALIVLILCAGLVAVYVTGTQRTPRESISKTPAEKKTIVLASSTDKSERDSPPTEPLRAIAPFTVAEAERHQKNWATHLGVPLRYIDPLGIEFALIPPGEFLMGTEENELNERLTVAKNFGWEPWRIENLKAEGPQHKVTITKPFYLGIHEVTTEQFARFVELTHFRTIADETAGQPTWRNPRGRPALPKTPVRRIAHADAVAFCERLGRLHEATYRLPTEAEWEYACRSGTTTAYYFGDTLTISKAAVEGLGDDFNPVGKYPPNAFGVRDMHGNATEWCLDSIMDQYDPARSVDPLVNEGNDRVLRGGAAGLEPESARSAVRRGKPATSQTEVTGFRMAMPVEAVRQAIHSESANRRAAEELLAIANPDCGIIVIDTAGNETLLKKGDPLPQIRFQVQRILFIGCPELTDSLLNSHLAHLRNLEWLMIEDCKNVTDRVMANVATKQHLRELRIFSSSITSEGVLKIARLPKLTRLQMHGDQLSSEVLARMQGSTIRELIVEGGNPPPMREIATLTQLVSLGWASAPFDREALREILVRCDKLFSLDLHNCSIDDEDLRVLSTNATLSSLYVSHTRITDAGLEHLASMKQLRELSIGNNKVSPAAVERLKSQLPETKILAEGISG